MKHTPFAGHWRIALGSLGVLSVLVMAAMACLRDEPTDSETGLTHREACGDGASASGDDDTDLGDPLPGLSPDELDRFMAGRAAFEKEEGIQDGLGPVFNDVSCAACHKSPAVGGGSEVFSTRIGTMRGEVFDPLEDFGGPTIQTKGIGVVEGHDFVGEVVPKEATIVAHRRATPTFGFGLVDAVPDSTLEFIGNMQSRFSPATAGRPNVVVNLRTGKSAAGRFGWKAQAATVFDFSAGAYKDEIGITVPGLHSGSDGSNVADENCPQGDCDALDFNPVPSPNDADTDDVAAFADFVGLLAPPSRGRITRNVVAGAVAFRRIGCASCHLPTLRTGPSEVKALDHVVFHPFSDFLLHDMGALGDGIEQGIASGREMRTAPLWGLRDQPVFLHDGRAETVRQAVLEHDGQAGRARDRFRHLSDHERGQLLEFLDSL